MIYYLVKAGYDNGIRSYADSWGPSPGSRMRLLYYEDLPRLGLLPAGTYVFSDLERLSEAEREMAVQAWGILSLAGPEVRLLNDPSRVLGRYELLRVLYEKGQNRYRVAKASEPTSSLRFPVFLKRANEHGHALPVLLHNPGELASALRYLRLRGHPPGDLLVVEFCDTSGGAGIFRKYSAFVVGERILPRHLVFSRNWIVKKPDLVEPDFVREQGKYLEGNPHEPWLRRIFRLAGIDYGRIDYSLLGDDPQIWEINTNPTVHNMTPRLTSAFEAIDCAPTAMRSFPLALDSRLVSDLEREKSRQRRRLALRKFFHGIRSRQPLDGLVRIVRFVYPNRWYKT